VRPVLRPGLRLLTDGAGGAVLVEHDRVYPLDHVSAALLDRLDGVADEAAVLGDDPDESARATWSRLRRAGVVVDVEAPAALVRALEERIRSVALHEATALVAHDPHTAGQRWQRRDGATVVVAGHGPVGIALAGLLEEAGVGRVLRAPAGHDTDSADRVGAAGPDVTVLTGDHEPAADLVERLMRDDRVHLVAGMRGPVGLVGPYVLPGRSACLRCVDQTRCDRDPAWAAARDRLSNRGGRGAGTAAPASRVITTAVAALAAAEVLAHVEGRPPSTVGVSATLTLLDPWPSLRRWPMHPACGCAWHTFAAARGQ
jgi:hypothetical protein